MTVNASDPSDTAVLAEDGHARPAALREQASRLSRAGDFARAIELLTRAAVIDPDEPRTQFELGVALQGARRHAEAVEHLARARTTLSNEPGPFLHMAFSLLALGKADDALHAATEASTRAPRSPQAHFARGRALLELGRSEQAEEALAAALKEAPAWADVWVHCGIARLRRGATESAKDAMREALRHAPGHVAATAHLAALERGEAGGRSVYARRAADDDGVFNAWRPNNPPLALGLAVGFLRKKPVFAKLQFGEWSQVLATQIERGHYLFVIDQQRKIRGFLGWALTDEALAETWVEGRAGLRNEQCLAGDCVIINGWSADSLRVNRFIVDTGRRLFADKRTLYFKRYYPNGRMRPMRLSVNDFVVEHLARATARGGDSKVEVDSAADTKPS